MKKSTSKNIKIRLIFMGTSFFAREILNFLIGENYNLVAVFTSPDVRQGRDSELKYSPVKKLALEKNIPVYQPDVLSEEVVGKIKELRPDLILVADYGKILPASLLALPGFGCLNVHPSLLPKYRGPSPIQNVLLNGEKETGVSIILMNEKVDAGPIVDSQKTKIDLRETSSDLKKRLLALSLDLLKRVLPLWIERKIEAQTQDEKQATYCQLIERSDGRVIWEEDALKIYNKYRAFHPWPGLFCFWKNSKGSLERLKLLEIDLIKKNDYLPRRPGEVFLQDSDVLVNTSQGCIVLKKVQLEGKNPVSISDFINGYPDFIGSFLN